MRSPLPGLRGPVKKCLAPQPLTISRLNSSGMGDEFDKRRTRVELGAVWRGSAVKTLRHGQGPDPMGAIPFGHPSVTPLKIVIVFEKRDPAFVIKFQRGIQYCQGVHDHDWASASSPGTYLRGKDRCARFELPAEAALAACRFPFSVGAPTSPFSLGLGSAFLEGRLRSIQQRALFALRVPGQSAVSLSALR
jgi:hypothetical protein